MIPRIVHYCWLSQDPVPKQMQRYVTQWRNLLPNYEFVLWDYNSLERFSDVPWVSEALAERKYAFAADYIRFYAVYTMGGIYMDMDVELLRSFDELLERSYFFGVEYDDYPEAGIFGAEKGNALIRTCLEFYHSRHFIPDELTLTTCKAPQVIHNSLVEQGFSFIITDQVNSKPGIVCLLPHDYLTAMNADTGVAHPTSRTITIHHFAGSWCYTTISSRMRRMLKVLASHLLGERLVRAIRNCF